MRFGVPEWGHNGPRDDHHPSLPPHGGGVESQDDKEHVCRVIKALEDNTQDNKEHVRRVINANARGNDGQSHDDRARRMANPGGPMLPGGGFAAHAPPAPAPLRPRNYTWSGYSGLAPAPFRPSADAPMATAFGNLTVGHTCPAGGAHAGAFGATQHDGRRHPPHRQPENNDRRHDVRQPANPGQLDDGTRYHPMFAVRPHLHGPHRVASGPALPGSVALLREGSTSL